jgi:hypothetical protein
MNISEVNDLYLLKRGRSTVWFGPNLDGMAVALEPQPTMLRTNYVYSPLEPNNLATAKGRLSDERAWIMALATCPDGPPYRTALLFIFGREVEWNDGGGPAYLYQRATRDFNPGSTDDFWLTGGPGTTEASLWRLFRAELDALNRWVVTLSPVRPSSRFPSADFSGLKIPLLRRSVQDQYAALASAITSNSYLAVVTHARNIVEGIVADKLSNADASRDLSQNLQTVRKLLESSPEDGSCGWRYLEYHLAQKIRLVHGQTHATSSTKIGRHLRPEFALSVTEDLIELLTTWGFCKGP